MTRPYMSIIALSLLALSARAGGAQRSVFDSITTRHGRCAVQVFIAGFSGPADSAYNRCAIDSGPTLRPGARMPDAPFAGPSANAAWTMVVNTDGTVEPALLRLLSSSGDTAFVRGTIETILQWRFEPGVRQGQPVRSGFTLVVRSDHRNDTLPARMEWTYHQGLNSDTLRGKWIAEAPLPPFSDVQRDSVHAALLRHLLQTQIVIRDRGEPYCLVMADGDSAAHARLTEIAWRMLSSTVSPYRRQLGRYGCERDPGALRIVMPRLHRTENGRVILHASGDYLPNYPAGYDGRAWRSWRGRCVGYVPAEGSAGVSCGIGPITLPGEWQEYMRGRADTARQSAPRPANDSMRLTIMAMTQGAFHADTIRTTVGPIPRLSERAVFDTAPPCPSSWQVHSAQDSANLLAIAGELTFRGYLHITRATKTALPTPPGTPLPPCPMRRPGGPGYFAAFLLGNVGDRATSPITVCYSSCAKKYVLDPGRHTLAEQPHFILRLADLRPETRAGGALIYRIQLENGPPDVIPIAVYRSTRGWGYSAWPARPLAPGLWDYPVHIDMSDWPGLEVHIYLVAK